MTDALQTCSGCGKMTSELCGGDMCRACHVSITFEDCVGRTTPDELAWKARKRAAGIPEDQL